MTRHARKSRKTVIGFLIAVGMCLGIATIVVAQSGGGLGISLNSPTSFPVDI